ncbi:unnamed protein product [Phyllotreta striolata]|uniref:Uncharacterized protein n=1 Tax=Phyllotreta striolata TaxID=444603 RepID=A0A9P0GYK0_PHYSR|nr:unnamed protein product [Phyllotreta striolata]
MSDSSTEEDVDLTEFKLEKRDISPAPPRRSINTLGSYSLSPFAFTAQESNLPSTSDEFSKKIRSKSPIAVVQTKVSIDKTTKTSNKSLASSKEFKMVKENPANINLPSLLPMQNEFLVSTKEIKHVTRSRTPKNKTVIYKNKSLSPIRLLKPSKVSKETKHSKYNSPSQRKILAKRMQEITSTKSEEAKSAERRSRSLASRWIVPTKPKETEPSKTRSNSSPNKRSRTPTANKSLTESLPKKTPAEQLPKKTSKEAEVKRPSSSRKKLKEDIESRRPREITKRKKLQNRATSPIKSLAKTPTSKPKSSKPSHSPKVHHTKIVYSNEYIKKRSFTFSAPFRRAASTQYGRTSRDKSVETSTLPQEVACEHRVCRVADSSGNLYSFLFKLV